MNTMFLDISKKVGDPSAVTVVKKEGYKPKKKNCYNCKYLDYYEPYYESHDSGGYSCEARVYKTEKAETDHLEKLNCTGDYLEKPKKCCELRIK